MTTVRELARSPMVVANADESVRDAGERMHALALPCLPVLNDRGAMVGILTIWDVRRAHPNRLVVDAMTTTYTIATPATGVWEAHTLLNQLGADYMPVMDAGRLLGIATRTDVEIAVARLTDALTGLPTAAHLRHRIKLAWAAQKDPCLLFLDINNFGDYNKAHGHAAGDHAIRSIGKVLTTLCDPERDVLCRYGGDEFAILTERPPAEVQRFAAQIIDEVGAPLAHLSASVSLGIARGRRWSAEPIEESHVDTFINVASLASTKAKRGVNRLVIIDAAVGLGDASQGSVASQG